MEEDTKKTAEELARAAEAAGIAAEKIREFREGMADAATSAEAIRNFVEELSAASESETGTTAERLELDRQRIAIASRLVDLARESGIVAGEELDELRNIVEERKKINSLLASEERLIERAKTKLIGYKEESIGIKYHLLAIQDIWTNMSKQEALSRVINKAATAIFSFGNAVFQASLEFDKVAASVAKATSTTQFKGAMEELRTEALATGVMVEQLGQNFVTLNNNFTEFNRLDAAAATQLASTATALNAANFSAESFAKTLDLGVKALGMSESQVETFSKELVSFGKAAGIPLDRLSRDLASIGPKLVTFGSQGERVFKELALASKNLGIEMDKMYGIAEQYTTFEGAANAAAKLNSVLGGNFVNSLDLMNASLTNPVDAFRLLKDSMDASGKTFDDMTPAMKKVVAEAAGFSDISEAARAFNMDVDEGAEFLEEQAIKQEELNKMNKQFISFQEKINMLLAQMIPIVTPLINSLSSMADTLSELAKENEGIFKTLGWITIFVVGGALLIKFFLVFAANTVLLAKAFAGLGSAIMAVFTAMRNGGVRAIWQLIKNKLILKKVTDEVAEAEKRAREQSERTSRDNSFVKKITAIGRAAKGTWKEILALGAAIALVGVGVLAAAYGMSLLVEAFGQAGNNATEAVVAIGVLGLSFVGLIIAFAFAIKIMGASALMAAPGILALGGAIALIGLGIGLAAAGVALLVYSFGQVGKNADQAVSGIKAFSVGIGVLMAALIGLATFGTIGAAVLKMVALAALAIGVGIGIAAAGIGYMISQLIPVIEKSKEFASSLSEIKDSSKNFSDIATSFGDMANAIAVIDQNKLSMLSSMSADLTSITDLSPITTNLQAIASIDFSNVSSLADAINSIDTEKLERLANTEIKTTTTKPAQIEREMPVIQVQDIIVNKSIRTEEGEIIGKKEPININLTVPVKIDGADFKDVLVDIIKKEVRAESNRLASVNTTTE